MNDSAVLESSEIEDEINQDWKKIVLDSLNTGYREGAIAGKDSVFQSGFNRGYAEGFRNGFALGNYKGALKIKLQSEELDDALSSTRKGCCKICKTNNYKSIEECIQAQKAYSNNILKQLHSKHKDKCNIELQLI